MVERELLNKSIKVSASIYKLLSEYKIIPEESFNSAIKRLLEDNKKINENNSLDTRNELAKQFDAL